MGRIHWNYVLMDNLYVMDDQVRYTLSVYQDEVYFALPCDWDSRISYRGYNVNDGGMMLILRRVILFISSILLVTAVVIYLTLIVIFVIDNCGTFENSKKKIESVIQNVDYLKQNVDSLTERITDIDNKKIKGNKGFIVKKRLTAR